MFETTFPISLLTLFKKIVTIRKTAPIFFLLMLFLFVEAQADSLSVLTLGARPDDTIDDTNSFRRALQSNASIIDVPKGRYIMGDLETYLPIRSRKEIVCDPETVFLIPKHAKVSSTETRHGYIFRPVFGASIEDPPITNFSISGCRFIIESPDVTPILIDKENANHVLIEGVIIDGKGETLHNQAAYGILVNNGTDVTIRNTEISFTRGPAIVMRLPRKSLIEGNRIKFSGVDVAYTEKGPSLAEYKVDYWNSSGISFSGASGCNIIGNRIDWTGGAGIILRGGTANCENNTVASNILTNIGKGGIGIGINNEGGGSSLNNVIKDNVIKGYMQRWSDAGININHRGPRGEIQNITISNNIIDLFGPDASKYRFPTHYEFIKTYGAQIIIDPSETGYADNITISGNSFQNSIGPAVAAKRLRNSFIVDNSIGNSCRALSEGTHGLRKSECSPIVVKEALNIKVNSNKFLTKMKSVINISAQYSEVRNNLIFYCGQEDTVEETESVSGTANTVTDNIMGGCKTAEPF